MTQNKKPTKQYATNTAQQRACCFRLDYSYFINHKCLDCEFCYSKVDPPLKMLDRQFNTRFPSEKLYNTNLYKTPITISRNCDPLYSEGTTNNSYFMCKDFLDNKSQVIFKTAIHEIPERFIELFEKSKEDVLIQFRVVVDDSYLGDIVRGSISPKFSSTKNILDKAEELVNKGLNVSIIIDPFIIGINDGDVANIISKAYSKGISKFTIKQLFATDYFKSFLSKMIDKKFIDILSDKYANKFYTYDNMVYLGALLPILEKIQNLEDVYIGICCNSVVNKLVCKHDNCCLFDNPLGKYNPNISPMLRNVNVHKNILSVDKNKKHEPLINILRERDVS